MHILLLTAYYPPDVGSAAHLFYELGGALAKRGHAVSVVTGMPGYHAQGDLSRYRGRWSMVEEINGMRVHRAAVPEVARNHPVGRALWQFSCASTFALTGLRIGRPDAVLVYSPPLPLGLTALFWRSLRNAPCVVNVQDLFPQSVIDLGILRQPELIRTFRALERFVYAHADVITVHSPGNQRHVLSCGGREDRTRVIHNWVDTEYLRPGPRNNGLRRELGLDNSFVVSFAGVIGFSQDLDTIVEAARLLRSHNDIRFLLVGDGAEKERLQRKAQDQRLDNVVWLPMQSRECYPLVLQASDVGLATLRAGVKTPVVPSKILSIMSAGRPTVACVDPAGDAPALVSAAEAGFCLPPEQPQALAECLLRLHDSPELCRRLGENGRRYAETHLSLQAAANQYEQLLASLT
jgi:colanic acid biosynthesis glycosyl transferase WcaI